MQRHFVRNRFIIAMRLLWVVLLCGVAAGCGMPPALVQRGATQAPVTRTPFQPLPVGVHSLAALTALPPAPTYTPWGEFLPVTASAPADELQPPVVTAQPAPSYTLWVAPDLPEALRARLALPYDFTLAESLENAMLRLQISPERPVSRWIYALVAPFPTVVDGVSLGDLQAAWRGQAGGPFSGRPLLMDEETRGVFSALWGEPAASTVLTLPSAELLDRAWKNRPAWAIVPFEAIEPRWKTLLVDGQSPLHKDFDSAAYPLSVPVSLLGEQSLAEVVTAVYGAAMLPASNRDPQRLTVLAMTGVTALVRATAYAMERQGVTYPAGDVAGWLSQADITHISNEVPFAQGCPFPDPFQQGVRFCSDPRYIELLQVIGTDVVELTGDHFHDWGVEAMHFTLELYRQLGWPYYGGGENIEDGRKALLMEHNGNRLAFIGCNGKGGSFAQAGPDHPGSVACSFDFMESEIARLRSEGILPIATFQHFEYYTYQAQPDQQRDFRRMAQAGAVIVSGSQAHQPQGLELLNGALIHYGLGNLFFDQYEVSLATRQGFIDRHVFYDGRYLGVELLSILFIDYARPRPMTASERLQLLESVFAASGW